MARSSHSEASVNPLSENRPTGHPSTNQWPLKDWPTSVGRTSTNPDAITELFLRTQAQPSPKHDNHIKPLVV
jgi:hypothetical protein